jgi:hypothetical protein
MGQVPVDVAYGLLRRDGNGEPVSDAGTLPLEAERKDPAAGVESATGVAQTESAVTAARTRVAVEVLSAPGDSVREMDSECPVRSTPSITIAPSKPWSPQLMAVVDRRRSVDSYTVRDTVHKVAKRIAEARCAARVPGFEKNKNVTELVIASIKKRGEFYNDGVRSYVFLNDDRVLLPIDVAEPGLELLLHQYGLFPKEFVTKQVIDALRLEALERGQRTDVHAFSKYSRAAHVLYVYDFDGGVYRIEPTAINHIHNGTDGVLFVQNPQWAPLELASIGGTLDWREWLFEGIHFANSVLNDSDQKLLFQFWVLALFFPQLFPTRVILAMIGEKGSRKTSLLRRLGQVLFGPKFNVAMLTAKPDDFDAAITSDAFVVADNADEAPKWFADKLAVAATGGLIKRRILYTTNRLGEFPIVANLGITSRTPNFTREDIAERLLPLFVIRDGDFTPESALLQDVEARRNEIVGSLLLDVQRALYQLKEHGGKVHRTAFRMADFADFVLKIAPVLSTVDAVQTLLDRLAQQQVAFASQDEPLFEMLDRWLTQEHPYVNLEREVALSKLGEELDNLAFDCSLPWKRGNAKSFGQYVRNHKATLRELYQMTWREAHAGSVLVSFKPRQR